MRSPLIWLRSISRYKANLTAVPSFALALSVKKWLALGNQKSAEGLLDLSSLYLVVLGGEPVSIDAVQKFHEVFKEYGLGDRVVRPAFGLAVSIKLH